MAGIVLGIPPAVINLVQTGLLERAFHDTLYPALAYRAEAMVEEWGANTGTELFMSRPGLLTPTTLSLNPGTDPVPQALTYEQWVARLARYAGTIDTHMPTSVIANANVFMRNIQQLGLQAGQSLNRIPRNAIFQAYLSGQTLSTVAALNTDTQIQVAAVNGFTDVVLTGSTSRPVPVSPSTPLPCTINLAVPVAVNVVGFTLANPSDPNGPGTLLLAAAIGSNIPARTAVLALAAPTVIRAGGGNSVDAIGAGDTFTLQDVVNAVAILRKNNVQPHDDGFYHAHISPQSNAQVFTDPVWQRLNTALPEHVIYKEGFIGTIAGVLFFMNVESPDTSNVTALTSTGTFAFYGQDIGSEVINNANVKIGRILITGKAAMYEKWLNEWQYISEAGVTGKVGEFDIINNGISVMTERVRLVLRSPIDRLQDIVSATWSISTSFPIPSDVTALTGPQRYKRAVIIEHAL